MTESSSSGAQTSSEAAASQGRPATTWGIVLISLYLILLALFLLISVLQLWEPAARTVPEAGPTVVSVEFFAWSFEMADEVRMLLLVVLAGALGSLLHAIRSLYWYVGHRELVRSWLLKYILLPFSGATLALIFYVVIRSGFLSPQATVDQTNPFGFVGVAGLIGLFSEQAVLKLKEVAETLLFKPKPGADAVPTEEQGTGAAPPQEPGADAVPPQEPEGDAAPPQEPEGDPVPPQEPEAEDA